MEAEEYEVSFDKDLVDIAISDIVETFLDQKAYPVSLLEGDVEFLSGCITLADSRGKHNLLLFINCDSALAKKVAGSIYDQEVEYIKDEELVETFKELVNLSGGQLSFLTGIEYHLGLPCFLGVNDSGLPVSVSDTDIVLDSLLKTEGSYIEIILVKL